MSRSNNKEKCKDDLKKLYGLPPYNTTTNYCNGDNYFAKYVTDNYYKETITQAKKELGIN